METLALQVTLMSKPLQ
ncbi:UNVERIFIED_CONTAM: hypothetical protein GTU68_047832 [Idotea baltica]|nr:hypothetical protein [Idotea baltica]